MKPMEPPDWWEFTIDIFPDERTQQWVASVTYGPHPDAVVTKTWLHPKLSVVQGMSMAFMLATVARINKTPPITTEEFLKEDAEQIQLL